jgi:hypothetical protein
MRIFFYELKKLWNWRILAVIIALGALTWFAVLSDSLSSYDSLTTHGIYGKYQTEMFGLYGEELSAEELADYNIQRKLSAVYAEADAIIAANPIFAGYDISNFADYLEYEGGLTYIFVGDVAVITMRNGETVTEGDYAEMDALLNGGGSEKTIDEWYDSPAIRALSLKALRFRYEDYRNGLDPYIQNDMRPVVAQAAERLAQTRNASLIRYDLCSAFSMYTAIVGVFSVLAVIIFVAPLIATDRARKLNLLQYSSAVGRKIFKIQAAAIAVSAFVLSLIIIVAGYIPFLTVSREYLNAHIMASDSNGMWLYDITFRQYAIVLAAISLAFSVGTACFASVIARFSANPVTLMIKAVPAGTAVATIAALALVQSLSSSSLLMSGSIARITGGIPYIEVIVCGVVIAIGIVTAVMVARRERKVEVL